MVGRADHQREDLPILWQPMAGRPQEEFLRRVEFEAGKRFVDLGPRQPYIDLETGLSRVFIRARVYDNPILTRNDPGYVQRLLNAWGTEGGQLGVSAGGAQ